MREDNVVVLKPPTQFVPDRRDEEAMLVQLDALIELTKQAEAMAADRRPITLKHIDMDEPVKVEDAIYLPEVGGVFAADPKLRQASETLSVKTLRAAISDGSLAVIEIRTRQFLTRTDIKDWLNSCRVQRTPSASSCNQTATKMARSLTKRSGTSVTMESQSSLDAGRTMFQKLKHS